MSIDRLPTMKPDYADLDAMRLATKTYTRELVDALRAELSVKSEKIMELETRISAIEAIFADLDRALTWLDSPGDRPCGTEP